MPRDSSQQYVWVRKAEDFNAVVGRKEDSFEFDDLKPGDLLFWRGTYNIDRDPPITHTMIYLGREKRTNKRVMVDPAMAVPMTASNVGASAFSISKCRHHPKAATPKLVRSLLATVLYQD